ncbi:MAG: hypothetical protein NC337_00285 [Roseburia sp.]|nr:hypothetical protein [Roseburia sp.]
MREQIKQVIIEEFSKLTELIEADFTDNYRRKTNNFLLSQMDKRITANMVFVSSFESKSGFATESCAKRIARMRFGEENVPAVVNPRKLSHSIDVSSIAGQVVVTDVDTFNGDLRGKIASFRANNEANGRGQGRRESTVTQETIRECLLPLSAEYRTDEIFTKPVDLAFYDGENWNICELTGGGALDSSNAPSNVEKLLTIYVDMGVENCKAYFATLYNKDGEGNAWKSVIKKHLNYPSMFLIGSNLWNKILPSDISFDDFTQIYKEALDEIDLNSRITLMIDQCLKAV